MLLYLFKARFPIPFLILFAWAASLNAAHITSGSMEYICNGNDEYEFQLNLERDCFGGGSSFDENIQIYIYLYIRKMDFIRPSS